jgi:hypothetical protein
MESLTTGPELENGLGHSRRFALRKNSEAFSAITESRHGGARQFAAACCASVRGLGQLANDDKRCPVFGVCLFGVLVDHRQHGCAQRLGVRQLWIGGKRRDRPSG